MPAPLFRAEQPEQIIHYHADLIPRLVLFICRLPLSTTTILRCVIPKKLIKTAIYHTPNSNQSPTDRGSPIPSLGQGEITYMSDFNANRPRVVGCHTSAILGSREIPITSGFGRHPKGRSLTFPHFPDTARGKWPRVWSAIIQCQRISI